MSDNQSSREGMPTLALAALGIVYGDITAKYVLFVMRADNRGEGGIMALMALALRPMREGSRRHAIIVTLGLIGAALFYGDGVITPAISVLSAVEGLEVATPAFKPYVIPITLVVLLVLFLFQRRGTGGIGALFGPVMAVWFLTLAVLGLGNIAAEPHVVVALNPLAGLAFFAANPALGFFSLGAVVLAVTGGEALYADMGHFGRRPVQYAWLGLVLPALVLNYFGQGALLLHDPKAIDNPFYLMAPAGLLLPLVALATVATVIASQAVISGAFSMTQQAIQLGYLARHLWRWPWWAALALAAPFFVIDAAFFSANFLKIPDGGWFPLVFGLAVFTLLTTWKSGRRLLHARLAADAIDFDAFVAGLHPGDVTRVPGTAVFLTQNLDIVPHSLLHSLKHYKALHRRVVLLTVKVADVPRINEAQRVSVEKMANDFWRVKVFYGFMDEPDLPRALEWCTEQCLDFDMMDTSFFLGRETLIPQLGSQMSLWREKLFVAMFRNAGSAANFFHLPANRVVELGAQIVL